MITDCLDGRKLMVVKLTCKCVSLEINLDIPTRLPETVDSMDGWNIMEMPASLRLLMD